MQKVGENQKGAKYKEMRYNLTVSVVLFNTKVSEIWNIIEIVKKTNLKVKLYFVDNSPQRGLEEHLGKIDDSIEYHFTNKNLGFGSGHNIVIKKVKDISEYHLVLNADIYFRPSVLEEIYDYMKERPEIGLIAPKIYNPDGTIQYSVKLLPTPLNLIVRRFVPIKWLQKKLDHTYEFHFFTFDKIIEIPYAMGCFMFINCDVFEDVKGFDERFFMYPEDIDLTRRIHKVKKTIYLPSVSIVHTHGRGSYKSKKLLYHHVFSMIKYFNKWGWVFDDERKRINKKILGQFKDH